MTQELLKLSDQHVFYALLFEFLKKKGHSPKIEGDLNEIFNHHEADFFLKRKELSELLSDYHKISNPEIQRVTRARVCDFAFMDLIDFFENPETQNLFTALLKLSKQEDHVYVLMLTQDHDFPFHCPCISNNPEKFKEGVGTLPREKLHVFHEGEIL